MLEWNVFRVKGISSMHIAFYWILYISFEIAYLIFIKFNNNYPQDACKRTRVKGDKNTSLQLTKASVNSLEKKVLFLIVLEE